MVASDPSGDRLPALRLLARLRRKAGGSPPRCCGSSSRGSMPEISSSWLSTTPHQAVGAPTSLRRARDKRAECSPTLRGRESASQPKIKNRLQVIPSFPVGRWPQRLTCFGLDDLYRWPSKPARQTSKPWKTRANRADPYRPGQWAVWAEPGIRLERAPEEQSSGRHSQIEAARSLGERTVHLMRSQGASSHQRRKAPGTLIASVQ